MKKENIMSAVLGLIVGLVVGFVFANSVNKTGYEKPAIAAAQSASGSEANPALPADHPPLGISSGNAAGGALPQVTEAIDKAKQQPQDFEAQMTAGDLYYQIRRFDEAAEFYLAAAKLKPVDAEAPAKAGNAFFDAKRFEEAEKWYLRALEKDPKNINARTDLGLTFYLRTPPDYTRAIKEFNTSLTMDPNHEITLQNLTVAYEKSGDTDAHRTTLEKLKKINPKNPAVLKKEPTL